MLRNRHVNRVKGQNGGCDPVGKTPEGFPEEVRGNERASEEKRGKYSWPMEWHV